MTRIKVVMVVAVVVLSVYATSYEREVMAEGTKSVSMNGYGDLSNKEHCIGNLQLSFNERNFGKYLEVLHPNYKVYCVEIAEGGQANGAVRDTAECADYEKDTLMTRKMFEKAPVLRIELGDGTWQRINFFRGQPCEECWQTARAEEIASEFGTQKGDLGLVVSLYEGKWKILALIEGREAGKDAAAERSNSR